MNTMLPAPPKSLGRLGEVLKSSLAAIQGADNTFAFDSKRVICVVMVDGLGSVNLSAAGGHASFLNSQQYQKQSCFFPATTSTSLTSFATGLKPAETKFTGYQVFDRQENVGMNLLSGWNSYDEGARFQARETLSEQAVGLGFDFHVVSPSSYEASGFTGATMRSAKYTAANLVEQRFQAAKELLKFSKGLIYLYVPELDQTAHAFGVSSNKWLNQLESLDGLIRDLVSSLPKDAGVIVTADHGVVDVDSSNHIYLDEIIQRDELDYVGGDTRALQLYLKEAAGSPETLEKLVNVVGDSCYVVTPQELAAAGWWELPEYGRYLPDLLVLARKQVALYHRDFAKKKSLLMVGHHGSITDAELSIPLIRFNV